MGHWTSRPGARRNRARTLDLDSTEEEKREDRREQIDQSPDFDAQQKKNEQIERSQKLWQMKSGCAMENDRRKLRRKSVR
jgi:hypothetical protein